MDEGNPLTSLAATGSVASRFVTQTEIDSARERREADWKAAYARIGQEPPPRPTEDPEYDGRSLYERLQANKTAKQEQWEEKNKLSNQFRALEEDEIHFLDGIIDEKITKERKRKEEENAELKNFRDAVTQRESQQAPAPVPVVSSSKPPPVKTTAPAPKAQSKKNQKALLKGAIVRKSSAPAASSSTTSSPSSASASAKTTTAIQSAAAAATSAPKSNDAAAKPASPPSSAKNESSVGQKRSESSTSEAAGETSEEAQSSKRQKI